MTAPTPCQGSTKHYLVVKRLQAKKPRLWLLHPTDSAPASTPALCVLMSDSESSFLELAQQLPQYTALAQDMVAPSFLDIDRDFMSRLYTRGSVTVPASLNAQQVTEAVKAALEFPPCFEVGLRRLHFLPTLTVYGIHVLHTRLHVPKHLPFDINAGLHAKRPCRDSAPMLMLTCTVVACQQCLVSNCAAQVEPNDAGVTFPSVLEPPPPLQRVSKTWQAIVANPSQHGDSDVEEEEVDTASSVPSAGRRQEVSERRPSDVPTRTDTH